MLNVEMGYFTVSHVRLGAKFGDLHAKDFYSFCKQLMLRHNSVGAESIGPSE